MLDAVLGEEHVLGAAEADALCAEEACLPGVARNVGVGADFQPADGVDPTHELDQIRIVGLHGDGLEPAHDDAAGGSIERDPVSLAQRVTLDAQFLVGLVDDTIAGSGYAA